MHTARVVAVDVGSVRGKFAWAALDLPEGNPVGEGGADPEGAVQSVLEALGREVPVALGFESPLMVPVPVAATHGWQSLGRARSGEGNRSWSAGAGSGALATGLAQMAWSLRRLAPWDSLSVTTQGQAWLSGENSLFLWEAFVSGPGKPVPGGVSQHAADAAAAADTFATWYEGRGAAEFDVLCDPCGSFNLAAAAVLYSGLAIEPEEIRMPLTVLQTRPAR